MGERYVHRHTTADWRTSCGRFHVVQRPDPSRNGGTVWCLRPSFPASSIGELFESGIFAPETRFPTRTAVVEALREVCESAGLAPPGGLKKLQTIQWQTTDHSVSVVRLSNAPQTWNALVLLVGPEGTRPTHEFEIGFPTRDVAVEWARRRQASGTPGRCTTRSEAMLRAREKASRRRAAASRRARTPTG